MDVSPLEQKFLDLFEREFPNEFEVQRNQHGLLYLSKQSPSESFGTLTVFIEPNMITIGCKITHTHCYSFEHARDGATDPEKGMIAEAIEKVSDLVQDRIIVSETYSPKGELICSGWRPVDAPADTNPEFDKLLEEQHGGAPVTKEWCWNGSFKN